jgi:hypothetical protein
MAKWDSAATTGMDELKKYFKADNSELDTLRASIAAWADKQKKDGTGYFKFRTADVSARVEGGWITRVDFGN